MTYSSTLYSVLLWGNLRAYYLSYHHHRVVLGASVQSGVAVSMLPRRKRARSLRHMPAPIQDNGQLSGTAPSYLVSLPDATGHRKAERVRVCPKRAVHVGVQWHYSEVSFISVMSCLQASGNSKNGGRSPKARPISNLLEQVDTHNFVVQQLLNSTLYD